MHNQIEDLNLTLSNLFFKNLNFLNKNYPKLANKVNELSKKIEYNQYEEKYTLEFKDNYFDILDHTTGKYIYGLNSYYEADIRKERLDFSQDSSLNLLRIDPRNNKFALMEGLGEITDFVHFLNQKIDFSSIKFTQIFKYVYLGVGLGIHMHEINKKINPYSTLIIEDNLETFRLSMFTIDYTSFTEKNHSLFLSIDENPQDKFLTLESFEKNNSWMNYNIKYQLFSINNQDNLSEIKNHFSIHHSSQFSYQEVLKVITRTNNIIKDKHHFLKLDLLIKNKPLKNKKILIISAGPSIDQNLDWIRDNQNKFIIVCVDIILRKLERNNIIPDIVVSIDPKPIISTFFNTEDKNFLKNSVIILSGQQNSNLLSKINHLSTFFIQAFPISKEPGFHFSVANVGTYSLGVSLFLGATEIYLAGSDAAFNQETGSRYSKDDTKVLIDTLEDNDTLKDKGFISESDVIEVKGNLRKKVNTNRELLRFKETYEFFINGHRQLNNEEFKVYNVSDGVDIEGTIPQEIEEINVKNIEDITFNKNIINDVSTQIKVLDFESDIILINSIISKVKKFQKLRIKNKDDFIKNKLDLMIWILKKKKEMSNIIFPDLFLRFTNLIDIYLNYSLHLNQTDLHTKDFLNELKQYWTNSLLLLLKEIKRSV